ncbi:acyl-CoA thioesterase [Marinicauda pacifica]|uniref:Acyl-CoA thioesterase n=1 Tax=Marinicauda pacifica TaxID=1133559 RepID=A0A4V3RZJ2_9PROT|nr:hotdog domain-containing protein [Marinicauda pacifica]TGY94479.1 acyl-CoA thioesterase [Marinicauda pacifica]GGE36140.1 acyl-CoA thioesterase [Marinicauda pacifica]
MSQPAHLAEIRHTDLVFPDQTNHQGTYFGGAAMAEMDKIAFLVAARHARRPFVTASCDRLDFEAPVYVGNLIELTGQVRMVGRTSMVVDVELSAEDLRTGERRLCTRGAFTMVAGDRKTNPARLPPSPDALPDFAASDAGFARVLQLVFPGDTNHLGQLFGGNAMSLMGKAAYIAAARHTRSDVGMAASDKIDFIAPTKEGELLDVIAQLSSVGRTSMQIAVRAEAEDLMSGERRLVGEATYVMVALDENGRPTPARRLEPHS